jgi:two-component system response regulator RstA
MERLRLTRILEEGGYEVVSTRDAITGLLVILDARPQCVMLAEELPPLSSSDIVRIVRRITSAPIAIIGHGGESDEIECLEGGADDYIRQPVRGPLLLARITSLIRRVRDSGSDPEAQNGRASAEPDSGPASRHDAAASKDTHLTDRTA